MVLASCFAFFISTASASVVSFEEARMEAELHDFIGQYVSSNMLGESASVVTLEDDQFTLWEAVGNIPSSGFSFLLRDYGRTIERDYRGSRGDGKVVFKINREGNTIIHHKVVT